MTTLYFKIYCSTIFLCLFGTTLPLQAFSETKPIKIVFLGDSLTAGYGISQADAYPNLVSQKAAQHGKNVEILNAGMSGDTSAGARRRLSWVIKNSPDILFIAIGANDGLRGLSLQELEKNLELIIEEVKRVLPDCSLALAGMKIPPNFGEQYTKDFEYLYKKLATKHRLKFLPFLLEGVATLPEYNLADQIHPNENGHKIIADNVWPVIEDLLKSFL